MKTHRSRHSVGIPVFAGLAAFLFALSPSASAFNAHQPFDISSDILEYADETQEMTARGHVVIVQSSSTLSADVVRYDRLHQRIIARGKVILREKDSVMLGDQLDYDLTLEKGMVMGGMGETSTWLFQGASWEKNKDYYVGRNASFTSCDLIDPHYHIRSSRVHLIPDRVFWAWNNVFYSDKTPVFYSPFVYKYLDEQRIVFQAQPGNDSQNGAFAKTTTTMRFTKHVYDKFYFDYYTEAGNGIGNELNFEKPNVYKGSLFSYYIDPHPSVLLPGQPSGPQYNLRGYLWQQLTPTTQLQANANLRENISFNTQYFSQDPNQSQNDIISSLALTQQTKNLNQHIVVQREDAPDSSAGGAFQTTHMQNASIPAYNFTLYQRPLWSPKSKTPALTPGTTAAYPAIMARPSKIGPILFSMSGSAQNQYQRADEEIHTGAQIIPSLSENFPFSRRWSFNTQLSPQLNWQDKGANTGVSTDTQKGYTGRVSFGNSLRWSPLSPVTIDAGHTLTERMKPNAFEFARDAADHGIDANNVALSANVRPSSRVLFRTSSAYDIRGLDDESLENYQQRKWAPWTTDLTYHPNRQWDYYASNQLAHYPMRTLSWQASANYRGIHKTILSSALLYNRGTPGLVTWNEGIGYFFSPGWRVDANFNAQVPSETIKSAEHSKLINTELILLRDMHCWNAQFIFRDRPPFSREFSLLFNVKLGGKAAKPIPNEDLESQFYPWRAGGPDPTVR